MNSRVWHSMFCCVHWLFSRRPWPCLRTPLGPLASVRGQGVFVQPCGGYSVQVCSKGFWAKDGMLARECGIELSASPSAESQAPSA